MQRIIFVYGALSGAIVIGGVILGLLLSGSDGDFQVLEWLGYLIMLVALSLVFVGIRQYRDQELGGVITFGKAALLGIGISAVAGIVYVAVWEIYLAATDYAFIGEYTAGLIEAERSAGLPDAELQAFIAEMEAMNSNYARPLYRLPLTFIEIFPVGLVVALVSAAVLRKMP